MGTGSFLREAELPEQKLQGDSVQFPTVLSPSTNTVMFEEIIKAEKPWLESLLNKCGVILFRGFPVASPSDFNHDVEAFGFPEALYIGGRASRTKVVGRIYTANESPPDKPIPYHHEMTYLGTKLEWNGNDVKAITGPLSAIRFDKGTQRKIWFNNLTGPMNGDGKIFEQGTFIELGNGEVVPNDAMEDCMSILEEECVIIPWKKGDVILINSLTVLHARQPLLK